MSNEPIDPNGIPQFTGDLEQLERDVADLRREASQFRDAGGDVHSDFQGLSAFYEAPEAEQLFATTKPVRTKTDEFADDLEKVAQALSRYATRVRPIVKKLKDLQTEASAFYIDEISTDDDWRKDDDKREHNNRLVEEVKGYTQTFRIAEMDCHNAITALVGGIRLTLSDDGTSSCGTYGYTDRVLDQAEKFPWGGKVEKERDGLDWLAHKALDVGKGFFVDGVGGTINALGTLAGKDGWGAAGEAWKNLAKLGTGLSLTMTPVGGLFWMAKDEQLPGWLRDSRRAVVDTGKGLIAYDQWSKNPARAGGLVGFNAVTIVATRGAGSAAKAGAAAKTVSAIGKFGRAVDPFTYAAKGVKFTTVKVGDLVAGLKNIRAGAHFDLPDGRYRLPAQNADVPVRFAAVPQDAIPYVNRKGTTVYLTREGAIVDESGRVVQKAGEAPGELTAAERADAAQGETSARRGPEHQPVLAGANVGDGAGAAGRGGADLPAGGPAPRHGAGESGHIAPGGSARDLHHGPSASHDALGNPGREGQPPSRGEQGGEGPFEGDRAHGTGHGEGSGDSGSHPPTSHGGGDGGTDHADPRSGERSGLGATADDQLDPADALTREGPLPGAGPGDKFLGKLDESRIVRDGNGLITHIDGHPLADRLQALSRDRAHVYIQAKDNGSFPKTQTGACVGAVVDRRTGQVFEGINGPGDALIPLNDLHPTLASRYEEIMTAGPPHPAAVLEHAEVKAVNRLLWERRKLGLPDDASALGEMRASVYFPFKKDRDLDVPVPPKAAPFCANCARMLHDVPSNSGRFTGWPPDMNQNFLPW
ncbi:YwqJ-related putative deaminase [Streptomyces alboflavus]|uniref:YwqJ-related putative deaminase n=1 Tax=Streptomyces alboflavus TaxID=67267 RepID=UPI000F656C2E|nr:YwqJ-related putative deaminase [Streptomyces alboflavus]